MLIITYYWPPSGGAGVQRWLKFAKYLPEFGWQPIIYTPENPEAPADDPSLFKDVSDETTVLKQPITEPYHLYKRFTGQKTDERINAGFLSEGRKPGIKQSLAAWVRGNLFIPDARKFWIKPSISFLDKYLNDTKVDAIVSTGPPHSMHLIARGIRTKHDIPWLADFRDPWTGIDYYKDLKLTDWADRKHKKLEIEVLKSADCIVSIGSNAAEEFVALGANRVEVITNGFDHEDFEGSINTELSDFTIVHAGAINKDRNHSVFWSSVKNLIVGGSFDDISLKIKLIGKVDFSVKRDIEQNQLQKYVELVPYVPHEEIVKLEKSASVLYLPVNNTPNAKGILTGKVFEYLGARRPILAIGPVDGDLWQILSKTRAGVISNFEDEQGFEDNLKKCIEEFKEGKLDVIDSDVDEFSRKNLTSKLSNTLNHMIE